VAAVDERASGPGRGDGASVGRPAGPGRENQGDDPTLPDLGTVGMLRWAWRQLTSMRTALLLLLLLAVGAIPGSVFPQRGVDPAVVARYRDDHPDASPWLDRLGLFDVYSSPWFSAVYLLLFVSLIGCVVPRTRVHYRALRARPPRPPSRLQRMPAHRSVVVDAPADAVLAAAHEVLRGRRYRADLLLDLDPSAVSAERGYLRETGNLVFHTALIGLLVAVAAGSLLGYRGQVVLTQDRGFANTLSQYDTFDPGTWVRAGDLPPFQLTFTDLQATFETDATGNQFAQPRDFSADVLVRRNPDGPALPATIRVNEPLDAGGANVYLSGNGYAPVLTVRDSTGAVAFSGPSVFLPQDAFYTSTGVVKVADTTEGLEQLGIQGIFAPTWQLDPERGPVSVFPSLGDPRLFFTVWTGDLGVDDGVPESAYALDTTGMTQLTGPDGQVFAAALSPGETVELPDGAGSVTFETVERFVALNVRHDPSKAAALVFSVLCMLGLVGSLFVPRRRVWVRAVPRESVPRESVPQESVPQESVPHESVSGQPSTVVEVAALARSEDPGLSREVDEVLRLVLQLVGGAGGHAGTHDSMDEGTSHSAGPTKEPAR
jgi:cytochrome c biogenesis protein